MEIVIPENRDRKPIHHFYNMELGERRVLDTITSSVALNCAKRQAQTRKLNWKFRTYTENGHTILVRVQ